MIQYDYLNNDKTILSSDGRKPDIKLLKGFNDKLIVGMGKAGSLKGLAFEDYLKITQENPDLLKLCRRLK
ncbi:hypothetical protein A45J_2717 [hot springs metagenome]|uniref:Uncharacterized protein n=1 Tax=hot springs metagenome TaxID=433727 RepID=A0A5J4L7F0_9ZZZZ